MSDRECCREFERLASELLDGDLPAAQAARLEAHGRACAACGSLLRTLRLTRRLCADESLLALPEDVSRRLHERLARELAAGREPGPRRLAWLWRRPWVAAAACLLLLALGAAQLRVRAVSVSGWLMDRHCLDAAGSAPATHPRACLLRCAQYGYGVLEQSGRFLAFDARGNRSAFAAISATSQSDHIWVTVSGRSNGRTIAVRQLRLAAPQTAAVWNRGPGATQVVRDGPGRGLDRADVRLWAAMIDPLLPSRLVASPARRVVCAGAAVAGKLAGAVGLVPR